MTRARPALVALVAFVALFLALSLAIGCKKSAPTTTPPPGGAAGGGSAACITPPPGEPMTQEQCTCLGGHMNASRGGEQEHCPTGETDLGPVRFGIEGAWCCKAP